MNRTFRTGNNLTHLFYRFSVAKRSDKYTSRFFLLIDGKQYYYHDLYTYDAYYATSTVTINVQLTKGQVVAVQNNWGDLLAGTHDGYMSSFFTGYMIAPL